MTIEDFMDNYMPGNLRVETNLKAAGFETTTYKDFTQASNKIVWALGKLEVDAIRWAAAQVATMES